jgi:hypothetical protein
MCRFSDAGNVIYAHARMPGVRKAPRHEIAGRTRGRPCRRLSYGDLSGERGAVSASARREVERFRRAKHAGGFARIRSGPEKRGLSRE